MHLAHGSEDSHMGQHHLLSSRDSLRVEEGIINNYTRATDENWGCLGEARCVVTRSIDSLSSLPAHTWSNELACPCAPH